MQKIALIMAGGVGERFWPKSNSKLPKQFLKLVDDEKTMLQLTVERILPIINIENIYISTNINYKGLVLEQIPQILEENIICEPCKRNTAPCIGLAMIKIKKRYKTAMITILASDTLVNNRDGFLSTLINAHNTALLTSSIVTVGIKPTRPDTNYGYIKYIKNDNKYFKVEKFVEKPNVELAKQYLECNNYFWNSGMFVSKLSTLINKYKKYVPDTYDKLMKIYDSFGNNNEIDILNEVFSSIEAKSIDYAIMEKEKNIYVVPSEFEWDDVGSWLSVERIKKKDSNGNIMKGKVVSLNTNNCIVETNGKLVATIGLENMIVVSTDDALLICNKNNESDIKQLLEKIKQEQQEML